MIAIVVATALLAPAPSVKVGLVGHSLVNHDMPQLLRSIAASKGKSLVVYEQVMNGSPLSLNWRESGNAEKHPENLYGDLRAEIERTPKPFDMVILTERVAIAESIQWEDTVGNLIHWRNHTLKRNPKARVALYSTWVGIHQDEWWKDVPDLPTWRKRTLADGQLFAKVAKEATSDPRSTPGSPIGLVPGHVAMTRLYDELEAGRLPWLGKSIRFAMADNIHLNKTGNYYIACLMYASIFNESPAGATGHCEGIWGGDLTNLPANQAAQLQNLAWQAYSEARASDGKKG